MCKEFIKASRDSSHEKYRHLADLETQTIARFLADVFSTKMSKVEGSGRSRFRVSYIETQVAYFPETDRYMSIEKRFVGPIQMIKYTNNGTYRCNMFSEDDDPEEFEEQMDTALAFSHFTYEYSGGYLLVCDLQGILTKHRERDVMLLTDPAIHCTHFPRFGATNLGKEGMDQFFSVHTCNKYCKALKLPARNT